MTAATNIFLGLALLLMQALAVFTPHTVSPLCRCCACGSQACSVPQTTSAPAPSPLASERVAEETKAPRLAESLDAPATASPTLVFFPSISRSSSEIRPVRLPIYRQHCALLI